MKLQDLNDKKFSEGYRPFEFNEKLEKIRKQLIYEEEYKKIKAREQRYLDKKKGEEKCSQKVGE
jgi:hypothetical protein